MSLAAKIGLAIIVLRWITASAALAQTTVSVDSFPQNLQLYQRGTTNLASVAIMGSLPAPYQQVSLRVLRNTALYFYQKQSFSVANAPNAFAFRPAVRAEAVEYDFSLYAFTSPTDSVLVVHRERIVCGDALILYGQSNVLALSDIDGYVVDDRLLRNFTYPFQSPDIPNQVSWSVAKQPYATVGGIGLWLQKLILEKYGIPTAVLNGGVGGTAILGLSARDVGNHANLNSYYGQLLYRAQRAGLANNARIIVYKQGEADAALNTEHYDAALRTLTDQFEEDYPGVKKIYVSQLNIISDPMPRGGDVRDAQRRAKQQAPLIETIATVGTPYYDGVHYTRPGNQQIATELFRQIARDFYGSTDTLQINSPDLKTAVYNARRDTITLTFDEPMRMVWPKDTTITNAKGATYTRRMIDFIYLDGQSGNVVNGFARRNQILLALNGPSTGQTITYLPSYYSDAYSPFYDGVHLKNERGLRAFSVDKFPLSTIGAPKLTQTISTSIAPTTTYGDYPLTLTAGASSALPVTYQVVSGPGKLINSHQIRLTGVGQVVVTVRQPGNEQYLPADEVTQSITVDKGGQYIGEIAQTARTSQLSITLSVTASSGLPVTYKLLSGPATLAGTVLTLSDFGQATLQLSQPGDDRYIPATDITRTICLNPQTPVISTDPASDLILVSSSPIRNQWFMNGDTLANGRAQQLPIHEAGTYVVRVTNPVAVCKSVAQSAARQVMILGVEPVTEAARLRVYPNPATDQVSIRLKSTNSTTPEIVLIDGSGRSLPEPIRLNPTAEGYGATFSVATLKSGFYFLRVTTENGPIVTRLLIRP